MRPKELPRIPEAFRWKRRRRVRPAVDRLGLGHTHQLHLPGLRDRGEQRLLHEAADDAMNQAPKP